LPSPKSYQLLPYMVALPIMNGRSGHHAGRPDPAPRGGVGFDIYCLEDIAPDDQVLLPPRWAWALLWLGGVPLAGMVYLTMGRSH